jgi:3-dehydroquinate synthase
VFCNARFVVLNTLFLSTLDNENTRSGYAEMLKHALISNEGMWSELLNFDLGQPNWETLQPMVVQSVKVKEEIVAQDPHEQGIRKALNLGHTVGHAFESFALHKGPQLLHGYAVAFGLVCELYLATFKTHFPVNKMRQTVQFIREYYGTLPLSCNDYDLLIELMQHDKKNASKEINFTLLADIGQPIINQTASKEEIKEALDFFRETI